MYSQYDEEKYILEACTRGLGFAPTGVPGSFLDVGAWHPTQFSNTRALFELGWSGVMIEPSPGPMLNLLREYGNERRITLIQAAVTVDPGLVNLHVTDDAVTTANEAEFERWKNHAEFHGSMMVPGITLSAIAVQFGGFDFVNLDAEGISVDLLHQLFQFMQPKCICVEHDGREGEIIAACTPLHYHVVYGNGTNLVLVRG